MTPFFFEVSDLFLTCWVRPGPNTFEMVTKGRWSYGSSEVAIYSSHHNFHTMDSAVFLKSRTFGPLS
jgi:hypothetical protein